MSRKEKRKLLKKLKRVQVRRQVASQRPDGEEEDGNSGDENGGGEPAADDEQDRLWRQRDEEAHQEWLRKQKEEADRKVRREFTLLRVWEVQYYEYIRLGMWLRFVAPLSTE
jgi:hypothetical protein